MTIKGSCLCGGVTFEVDELEGPFEICHCSRCRKVTGAGGAPGVYVKTSAFRLLTGKELIRTYEAPILYAPPAYSVTFCSVCGSLAPIASDDWDHIEIPAGLFDDDLGMSPDKHIYAEYAPDWVSVDDGLPTFTREEIYKHRTGKDWPAETD